MYGRGDKIMGEKARLEKLWLKHPSTFRLDSGQGYVGGIQFVAKKDGVFSVKKGDIIIKNPTRIKYGIKGAGDLVGWSENNGVAVFTSIEDKSATDRIGLDQIIWLLNVRIAGGIALIYREGVELTDEEIMAAPRRPDKKVREKEEIIKRLWGRLYGE